MLPVQLAEIDIGIETRMGRIDREEEKKRGEALERGYFGEGGILESAHFGEGGIEERALASQQVAKQKACASVFQEWKAVTLKSGAKVPLVQEVKFCAEGDTYVEAQQSAEAKAKNFLDEIEKKRARDLERLSVPRPGRML